jgi:hypothetical protein
METQTSFSYLEAIGKSKIWAAYAEHFAGELIVEEGFNINSGYVYLALDNGIKIACAFGRSVEYITYDFDQIMELYFYHYEDLQKYLSIPN